MRKLQRLSFLLAVLLACVGINSAQQTTATRARANNQEKARSFLFVSPNTSENLTLFEALRRLNSPEEIALIVDGRRLACRLNLQARIAKTIGSWTDGAEHSTLLLLRADEETVRYVDARLGKRARQKSVLYFQQRSTGNARMYVLSLHGRKRSLLTIAQTLDRNGISDRTLVPGARRTLVYVVDLKNELQQRMEAAARQLGASRRVLEGTADFIGDESREKAQEVFAEIILKYETDHPPVKNKCPAEAAQTWFLPKRVTFSPAAQATIANQF